MYDSNRLVEEAMRRSMDTGIDYWKAYHDACQMQEITEDILDTDGKEK